MKLQWNYQQWGADAVLAGHAHAYERIIRNGLPYFTNGLGGESTGSFVAAHPDSVSRFGSNYGAQLVTVSSTSITFQFITRAGVVIDSYTIGPDAVTANAPTNLSAVSASASQINLAWTDNANNEDGYRIEQSADGTAFAEIGSVISNTTSYSVTNLSAGTPYIFRVRAQNNAGYSNYSNTSRATTTALTPIAPNNLTAEGVSASQINLLWTDASSDETGFRIERCTGANCSNFTEIAQIGADADSFQDTGRASNTTYQYRVRAFNGYGNSAFSNVASAATVLAPPTAPGGLSAEAVSNRRINLSWADNSTNELGFSIEQCVGNGCADFVEIAQVGANVKTFSNTGLLTATFYTYRVRAFNGAGNSSFSNVVQERTLIDPPAAPSGLTATAISKTRINLSWQDNSSTENGFRIERCKNANCTEFKQIARLSADARSYSDTDAKRDSTFKYRVVSFNAGGVSPYSNIAQATTPK